MYSADAWSDAPLAATSGNAVAPSVLRRIVMSQGPTMQVRQSTARTIVVGPIIDADGAPKTDEVVASIKIHKNGGAASTLDGAATLTHSHTGIYLLALTANEFDTLGAAEFSLHSSPNAMPVKAVNVLTPSAWDALHHTSAGMLRANVTQLNGDAQSATDLQDFADAGYDPVSHKVQGVVLVDTLATGAGTGARQVTITINDGATALQNARVRMTEGVNTYTALTNASGIALFNLDDATYAVAVTKSGYTYSGTTLVVDGTEAATYSMTAIVITPAANPAQSTLSITCFDEVGLPEPGATVTLQMIAVPTSDTGRAYDAKPIVLTANGSGVIEIAVARGAKYKRTRGTGLSDVITIPDAATCTFDSFIGRDE